MIKLGTYLEKAALLHLDYEVLLGAARLLAPFDRRPQRMEEWKRRGEDLRHQEQALSADYGVHAIVLASKPRP